MEKDDSADIFKDIVKDTDVNTFIDSVVEKSTNIKINKELAFCVDKCATSFEYKEIKQKEYKCLETCFYNLLENQNLDYLK